MRRLLIGILCLFTACKSKDTQPHKPTNMESAINHDYTKDGVIHKVVYNSNGDIIGYSNQQVGSDNEMFGYLLFPIKKPITYNITGGENPPIGNPNMSNNLTGAK